MNSKEILAMKYHLSNRDSDITIQIAGIVTLNKLEYLDKSKNLIQDSNYTMQTKLVIAERKLIQILKTKTSSALTNAINRKTSDQLGSVS